MHNFRNDILVIKTLQLQKKLKIFVYFASKINKITKKLNVKIKRNVILIYYQFFFSLSI